MRNNTDYVTGGYWLLESVNEMLSGELRGALRYRTVMDRAEKFASTNRRIGPPCTAVTLDVRRGAVTAQHRQQEIRDSHAPEQSFPPGKRGIESEARLALSPSPSRLKRLVKVSTLPRRAQEKRRRFGTDRAMLSGVGEEAPRLQQACYV